MSWWLLLVGLSAVLCQTVCRKETIGYSERGEPITVTIVDKWPERLNPRVKLVGNIHGDEIASAHVLLKLEDALCNATPIGVDLDNVAIYIVPSMNPDGYNALRRRNANDVDLDRNFPEKRYPEQRTSRAALQKETRAIIALTETYGPFSLCMQLHGGDRVVTYPYCGSSGARKRRVKSPTSYDDELLRELALNYSYVTPNIYYSALHPYGIKNCAQLFSFYGGMQDWNYEVHHCLSLGVGVSELVTPPFADMERIWLENVDGLYQWINTATDKSVHLERPYDSLDPLVLFETENPHRLTYPLVDRSREIQKFHRVLCCDVSRGLIIASALNHSDVREHLFVEKVE